MTRLKHYLSGLSGSFWFVPSLIVLASIAMAVGLIEVDTIKGHDWMEDWPRLFGAGAEGARGMLATIAGSVITVVGVTFSMTLMTLTLASNQYTSRVLRNFMGDRVTQVVLGIFAGIFTYCVIVLRTIRDNDGDDFVPSLSVVVSMVLAIGGVGALIFFIHHIASSIQASSIIASVARETLAAVDRLFPDELGQGTEDEHKETKHPLVENMIWSPVEAGRLGYLQHVDNGGLMRLAREHKTVLRMERRIGEFVLADSALVSAVGAKPPAKDVADAIRACFDIDRYRTLEQDAAFGVRQIEDIALRALSPSTNDSTTAVMCVDHLTAILSRMAERTIPSDYRYDDEGNLKLIARGPTFGGMLALGFDQIRASAEGNASLLVKLVDSLQTIADHARNDERRRAVRARLDDVAEVARRTLHAPRDRARFEERLARAGGLE